MNGIWLIIMCFLVKISGSRKFQVFLHLWLMEVRFGSDLSDLIILLNVISGVCLGEDAVFSMYCEAMNVNVFVILPSSFQYEVGASLG